MELSGWGRYPRHETRVISPECPDAAREAARSAKSWIARGNGRSYGDAAVGIEDTISMRAVGRMLSFDADTGRLTAEAGTLLADILTTFVPRGLFPPVVPGTKLVTLGGMVAADVHGKNHHRDGGFGRYVERLTLALADGTRVSCSRDERADLFEATIGGMGLTGAILDVTFCLERIETAWIRERVEVAHDLEQAMTALQDANVSHYCVAWIDCLAQGPSLGRSLIYRGEHATRDDVIRLGRSLPHFPSPDDARVSMPIDVPGFALNALTVRAFNELYFRSGAAGAGRENLVALEPFFFPLDAIRDWNRIYGKRGFVQHQCVLPFEGARDRLSEILGKIATSGRGSFLAVLKVLAAGDGLLSFPMPGYTLALDFSMSDGTLALLDEIDRLVVAAGGRIYLAKDARQSRGTLDAGYGHRIDTFQAVRRAYGADTRIQSHLAKRLGLS